MRVSIITPVLNGEKTIDSAIKSITSQSYKDIQYIIVDGGSTDGTMGIVKKVLGARDEGQIKIISEEDKGIYDAMNKGICAATGDVVGILNADDMYVSDKVLEMVMREFEAGVDICYGDLEYVKRDDITKVTRVWKAGEPPKNFQNGWAIPHPTLFVKKEVYDRIGSYRDDFRIAGDYEFMVRLFNIKAKIAYLPEVIVRMREGGKSGGGLRRRMEGWRELKRAWVVNDLKVPPLFVLRRVLLKLGQYLWK